MVAHNCNASTQESGQGQRLEFEASTVSDQTARPTRSTGQLHLALITTVRTRNCVSEAASHSLALHSSAQYPEKENPEGGAIMAC